MAALLTEEELESWYVAAQPKLYIGGKQTRPDGGYSAEVYDAAGNLVASLPKGSRKDIRNAVEAASASAAWSTMTGHARAQVLYFLAENLEYRKDEFVNLIAGLSGKSIGRQRRRSTIPSSGSLPAPPTRTNMRARYICLIKIE